MALTHVGVSGPKIHLIDGSYFDFEKPENGTYGIAAIAHALSMLCRFTGHVKYFYSVAQHSVAVSELVPEELALAALLHDAGEAFINDLSAPLKHAPWMHGYRDCEERVERAVFARFGVEEWLLPMHPYIKHADLVMLATEQRDLMPPSNEEWAVLNGIEPRDRKINPQPPEIARAYFLQRYVQLTSEHS